MKVLTFDSMALLEVNELIIEELNSGKWAIYGFLNRRSISGHELSKRVSIEYATLKEAKESLRIFSYNFDTFYFENEAALENKNANV
jgi:hypothetical protein